MEKVENIKRPLKIGEEFLVPCLVKKDGETIVSNYPVINHPHNDTENGQPEVHYHIDGRFKNITQDDKGRLQLSEDGEIEYHPMKVINETEDYITQLVFIRQSKLKHKCIVKGKCPHRGFSLKQISPELNEQTKEWEITCPLHGLRFDASTGKVTKQTLETLRMYKEREDDHKKEIQEGLKILNKIKDGEIISKELSDKLLVHTVMRMFCFETRPLENGYLDVTLIQTMSGDYHPKPVKNGMVFKFKVYENQEVNA